MNNLQTYFHHRNKYAKYDWKSYPIILRWMSLPRMTHEIEIIDKKVGYLLESSRKKLKEWFSSDNSLTQITAERYILDYLQERNKDNFIENFKGNGVDAYLKQGDELVGIEVTSINTSLATWLLQERLLMFLDMRNYQGTDTIRIKYSLSTIEKIKHSLDVVEEIGSAIISERKVVEMSGIQIMKEHHPVSSGLICWDENSEEYDLIALLKRRVKDILDLKLRQLGKNEHNILFICVNQLPLSAQNPTFFEELSSPHRYASEAQELHSYIQNILPNHIKGVCFFVYTLTSENPMYKLKIFWGNKLKSHNIKL